MRPLLSLLLCCAASLAQASPNFQFSNSQGAYGVGLHIVHQYDYARAYQRSVNLVTGEPSKGETARPIQTLVWYPAAKGGKPVTYETYMRTGATVEKFDRSEAEVSAYVASQFSGNDPDMSPARQREERSQPMWAVRDAKPAAGSFPVVIYAPSFSASAAENPELCEYLASQGYIVISSPSLGAQGRSMTTDLEGVEAQVADIAFLIRYAHTVPHANVGKLAVAGYSWGGISNVFAAARDTRIKALVALDGSMRYFPKLIADAGYVTPSRVAVPLLYLAQRPQSIEELSRSGRATAAPSFINAMRYADVYKVTNYAMEHGAFSSEFLHFGPSSRFQEYSRAEVSLANSWSSRYVHHFLGAYLKGDAASRSFLDNAPARNGVPPHLLSVDVQRAKGTPATREQGFEHAHAIYQSLHKQDPSFKLDEAEINQWGYQLLREYKQTKRAIAVMKLGTLLYPDSGNTYDSLAEAYESDDDKVQAIANYRRSLELDPGNENAVQHLAALGAAPAEGAAK
jgi:tetratricopeptide (TPR) repeat protein